MDTAIQHIPASALAQFCARWHIREFALFGSILRDDFRSDSDVDVLVTFADDATWSLLDQVQMQQELQVLFGRPVDLISRRALAASSNWLRRDAILRSAQVLYSSEKD
jgi:predicted nucleotidyltransferase